MNTESKSGGFISIFFNIIFIIIFLYASYKVFQTCQEIRHTWIITNIFNGLAGGVFIVFPINVLRWGVSKTFDIWLFLLLVMFILAAISNLIAGIIGFGAI